MSIINRKISIKCQTPKHLTKFYLLSLLPESESAKLGVMVVMVMIIIVVMLVREAFIYVLAEFVR
jgi:hypothetical protein